MTPPQRLNYDEIAAHYDEAFRDYAPDPHLIAFLAERPDLDPTPIRVLDVGCGTGKQLAADRHRLPSLPLVGLDLFRGMLHQAQKRGVGIHWVQGDGARQPFPAATFDYATNQFSYHHAVDKVGVFAEVYRVLKRGGRLVLLTIDPWAVPEWYIYRYFPAAQTRDQVDFFSTAALRDHLHAVGFAAIRTELFAPAQQERTLQEVYTFCRQRHRTSQFLIISDAEYQQGLARIQADRDHSGPDQPIPLGLKLLHVQADKPR
jgi:ubiquinone/menaquinone biosynthesis C-methylase UbiE